MVRVLLVAGLMLALVLPTVSSQQPTPLVEDPRGDVSAATLAALPGDAAAAADLTAFTIQADAATMTWTVQVSSLQGETPLADSIFYDVRATFEGMQYRLLIDRNVPVPVFSSGASYRSTLAVYEEGVGFREVLAPTATVDKAAGTMSVQFTHLDLRGPTGLPVRDNSELTDIHITTRLGAQAAPSEFNAPDGTQPLQAAPQAASDRMPNQGVVQYAVNIPVVSDQQILLQSPDPIRATNGGPGTFVFPLLATNLGDAPIDVDLTIDGLPNGWTASVVDARLPLPAQATRATSIIVQPPFVHEHGSVVNVTVTPTDKNGASLGNALDLQLFYSEPPQPSGHHPILYIHSLDRASILDVYDAAIEPTLGFTDRFAAMNANPEDERNTGDSVNARSFDTADGEGWRIPMSPNLGMGLDFRTDAPATFSGRFTSSNQVAIEDLVIKAQLLLETPAGETLLGESPPSAATRVTKDMPGTIDLVLAITEASDYIPYQPTSNLLLVITATYTDPTANLGAATPNLESGASLALPLAEYQDRIPPQEIGELQVNLAENEVPANPGDHVVFTLILKNAGTAALTADLEALDVSAIHSIEPRSLRIGAGDESRATIEIVVPAEAADGDRLAWYLAVRTADDQSALVRMVVDVTTQEEIASQVLAPAKQSPGPNLSVVMLAIAALGLARRRV